jgi:hypothetical protein
VSRDQISNVDLAWLRMVDSSNLFIITGGMGIFCGNLLYLEVNGFMVKHLSLHGRPLLAQIQ